MSDNASRSAWAIIYNPNGLILVLKRSPKVNNPSVWNLPGGGVNQKEIPREACCREVREEAGLKLSTSDLKFTRVILQPNRHLYFYSVNLKKDKQVKIDFESSEYKWLDKDEIKKLDLHKPTYLFFTT